MGIETLDFLRDEELDEGSTVVKSGNREKANLTLEELTAEAKAVSV